MTFVSQQSATKINFLIKMNYSIVEKPKLIPTIEANLKEKGKEKVGENKKDHIIFNKNSKIIKLGMNQNQNKSMNNQIKKVAQSGSFNKSSGRPMISDRSTQKQSQFRSTSQPSAPHRST